MAKARKKATRKAAAKQPGRKQCASAGCRKLRADGEFCPAHAVAQEPLNAVRKLDELDRLRWIELDTHIRNQAQAIRIAQLELSALNSKYQAQIAQCKSEMDRKQAENVALLRHLGSKYKFDPAKVIIDDQTGIIREDGPRGGV